MLKCHSFRINSIKCPVIQFLDVVFGSMVKIKFTTTYDKNSFGFVSYRKR